MSRMGNSIVWDYFDKDEDDYANKKAICKICNEKYSYVTTITNLKHHVYQKHITKCPVAFYPRSERTNLVNDSDAPNLLWSYFTKVNGKQGIARCNICHKEKSYKTTITNLKFHLERLHLEEYKRLKKNLPLISDRSQTTVHGDDEDSINSSDDNDADFEETQKLNGIWTYFEQEGETKARCVVCHEITTSSDYEYLKAHLFENHPKLMLQLVQQQDESQETKSNPETDVEDNNYTEVVYLEQDSAAEDPRPVEKPKIKKSYIKKPVRKRSRSSSSERHVYKVKKEIDVQEDSEMETFIKYMRCLLKKLTPDAFSKVQVDILKVIMDAQYSKNANSVLANNAQSPSILTEIANANVASVIRVSEIQDNSSLLGNYTVTLASTDDKVNK